MGIFSWFKNIFKKPITLKNIDSNHLVIMEKNNEKIKFGTMLEVVPDFTSVLVYRNKVTDVFTEGRHRLDIKNMPILSRVQKLTKPNKKGILPKNFKADVYYINSKAFNNAKFETFNDIVIKDKNYKKVSCKLSGNYSYQVTSPVDFMEGMFMRYGVLRDGIAKNEISSWVAEIVARVVQKRNLTVEKLYTRDSSCFENMISKLNENLSDVGLEILDFEVSDVKFPKKIYKRISLSFEEMHQKPQDMYVGEQHDLENPVKDALKKDFENQSNEIYLDEAQRVENEMNTKLLTVDSNGTSQVDTGISQSSNFNNPYIYNNNYEENASSINNDINSEVNDQSYMSTQQSMQNNQTNKQSVDLHKNNEQVDNNFQLGSNSQLQEVDDCEFEEMKYANNKIDLTPIQKTIEYKRCSNCGALNSNSTSTCFSCGHKFNK